MELTLILSGLLLGLAGSGHCLAMCSAPCAIATGQVGPARGGGAACAPAAGAGGSAAAVTWTFHVARVAGYSLAGAVVASSVGALASWGQWSPALRPLWTLVHAAALALGLWLLWQGRQPAWLEGLGRSARQQSVAAQGWSPLRGPMRRPLRAGALGAAWFAWPCGLLQSALVIAALANTAAGGAAVMAAFGTATAGGLLLGPWAWRHLRGGALPLDPRLAIRLAGAMLAAASAWSLGAGIWRAGLAYCFG